MKHLKNKKKNRQENVELKATQNKKALKGVYISFVYVWVTEIRHYWLG